MFLILISKHTPMKLRILLLTLLLSIQAIAQENNAKTETEWFDELMETYYDGDFMTAYLGLGQFIDKYPNSDLVPRATFNQAFLLRELGKDNEAKMILKRILNSEYNEYDSYGGIMEQYALYKNRSAKHLAEIALFEKEYEKASKYIYLFDQVYPYKHFCGNELSADEIYTQTMYAKMYHGKGKTTKAIKKLLPHMFFNGLAGNQEVLDLLNEYLPMVFSRDEIKSLLQESIESFKVKKNGNAQFTILDVKIPLDSYYLYDIQGSDWSNANENFDKKALVKLMENHEVWSNYLKETK